MRKQFIPYSNFNFNSNSSKVKSFSSANEKNSYVPFSNAFYVRDGKFVPPSYQFSRDDYEEPDEYFSD